MEQVRVVVDLALDGDSDDVPRYRLKDNLLERSLLQREKPRPLLDQRARHPPTPRVHSPDSDSVMAAWGPCTELVGAVFPEDAAADSAALWLPRSGG